MIRIVFVVEEAWTERKTFLLHPKADRRYLPTLAVEDQQSLARRGIVKLSKQERRDRLKIVAVHMYRRIRMNEVNRHDGFSACTMFRQRALTLAFTARSSR